MSEYPENPVRTAERMKRLKIGNARKQQGGSHVARGKGFVPEYKPVYRPNEAIDKEGYSNPLFAAVPSASEESSRPSTSASTSASASASASAGAPVVNVASAQAAASATGPTTGTLLMQEIDKRRQRLYESVLAFPFNKKRCRVVTTVEELRDNCKGIVYWMSREQRVQDNWSLLYAQKLALKQQVPLHVCFCLQPTHLGAPIRHFAFMIEGLKLVEKELKDLDIPFHVLLGPPKEQLTQFIDKHQIGGLIVDFSPLRVFKGWLQDLKAAVPSDFPILQVDGHNIVPSWQASDQLEVAAYTFRAKMHAKLDEYFTEFPPVVKHKYSLPFNEWPQPVNWENLYASLKCDTSVKKVDWAVSGYAAAIRVLDYFIRNSLRIYDEDRNEPNKNVATNLSPWYHFGQVSVQRCMLEVRKHMDRYEKPVQVCLEQSIVRRELADNFCDHQPNYDNFECADEWAKKTLVQHMSDRRKHLYTLEQLENFKTHDKLWNAAQIQMRVEGKMHGFFRMYWAKKILEWTESPMKAVEYTVYLNDKYELDGRDPNGYNGIAWAILGIHDHPFQERPITGKLRPMTYEGCTRKFDVDYFITKYYNKKHLA